VPYVQARSARRDGEASGWRYVADLNLRSYASAEWAYFGSTQSVVQDVRAFARRSRHMVDRYLPRKPHMFLFERMEGAPAPHALRTFTPAGRPVRGFTRPRINKG